MEQGSRPAVVGRRPRSRTSALVCALVRAAGLAVLTLTVSQPPARAVFDPSVLTDRATYAAGDHVDIVARGFSPHDPVALRVTTAEGVDLEADGAAWSKTADAAGELATSWVMMDHSERTSAFRVVAQGGGGPIASAVFRRRAAVTTDREGYAPGVPIAIRGRGFVPGEAVHLQAAHATDGSPSQDDGWSWSIHATEDGTIASAWSIPTMDGGADVFLLRATGATSGVATPVAFRRIAVVRTDKGDYQPGETAIITGEGFTSSEDVILQVTHANGSNHGNGHQPFVTTSDLDGRITATWFVDPDDSRGSQFLLAARGVTSGRIASAVFWDDGTVTLTAFGVAYQQDFDALADSGTSGAEPLGWDVAETGTNANGLYAAGTGSNTAGDTYSFGLSGSTERAFGGLQSGSLVPTVGVQFTNRTGGVITSLSIGYTGEMWRAGVSNRNAADRLDVQLSTDATSLITGTWAEVDALDLSSPNINTPVGALNGNAPENRSAIVSVIEGLAIPDGTTFWLRWTDFNIAGSDDGLAIDDVSLTASGMTVEDVPPTVTSTVPADGATGVAPAASVRIAFSEHVTVTDPWFSISCSVSGSHAAVVGGGPSIYTLTPTVVFVPGETCSVTMDGARVTDRDGTPDALTTNVTITFLISDPCGQTYTPIPAIQGAGATAALTGVVTTTGVVVGDYEYPGSGPTSAALRGFYLQDPVGDGDSDTSDGIFVFNAGNDSVAIGDLVVVSGTAGEFQGQTQLSNVTNIARCGSGGIVPSDITFPVPMVDFLERYEGMLVRVPQTMSVTEHFQLGRFGQVVLSANGRLSQPTSVAAPGAPALALRNENDRRSIILDDASQAQNPDPIPFGRDGQPLSAGNTLRGGDTATGIVGVLDYTWAGNAASRNAYRIRPLGALGGSIHFQSANPRPTTPEVGGTLRVVGMNLLNFFNTFTGCTGGVGESPIDCRGADSAAELARQHRKTVAAIVAMNPDVLAVNEIENDGYDATSALQLLTDVLNAATAPDTFAFIDADARTGRLNAMGTDAVKSALLYKPSVVTPIGRTAALNSVEFVNSGDSGPRNRPSIAQAFHVNASGARFVLSASHFKSKGAPCDAPDALDGQGNCNVVRTQAATLLANWLATDPTGTGDPDVLIVGDLNSYAMEDPVSVLRQAGYTNLAQSFVGPDAYSYAFDGEWGYLDHALASPSLVSQIAGVGEFHINADEPSVLDYNLEFKTTNLQTTLYAPDPFRMSDHDPIMVGLTLGSPFTVTMGGPNEVPEGGIVTVTATAGDSEGGTFSFTWDLDGDGSFETSGNPVTFSAAGVDGPNVATIQVRAVDPLGQSATASGTVAIANVAPMVDAPVMASAPSIEGVPTSVRAAFADPAAGADAPFKCAIDYGDGTAIHAGTIDAGTCVGQTHAYTAHGTYTVRVYVTDKDGGTSTSTVPHTVVLAWAGFFPPVESAPAWNRANADQTIPIAFSLGGERGLGVMAAGYPRSVRIACSSAGAVGGANATTAGIGPLRYDVSSDRYMVLWQSRKAWAGTCRELQVRLTDGTLHRARVRFVR